MCEASSSLTFPVHAVCSAKTGSPGSFLKYFGETLFMDIKDIHNCAYQGIRSGCAAGGRYFVYAGVMGLYVKNGVVYANPKKQVFQLQFAVGEFDMVVADSANATCEIYEVKHSKEQAKEQYRHLIDEEKLKNTEFRYGKITKKVVVYRGENTTLENGIEYRNVEEYLKSLI